MLVLENLFLASNQNRILKHRISCIVYIVMASLQRKFFGRTWGPLTKISMLVESRANVQNNYTEAKGAHTFRSVWNQMEWNDSCCITENTEKESKWNTPLLLPFTRDVQTLHSYFNVQQQDLHSKLSTEATPQRWSQLTMVILTQVILFRQRAGEVSKMPLSAYLSQIQPASQEDVNEALSDLEKKLSAFQEDRNKRKKGKKSSCAFDGKNMGFFRRTHLFARPSALTSWVLNLSLLQNYATNRNPVSGSQPQ